MFLYIHYIVFKLFLKKKTEKYKIGKHILSIKKIHHRMENEMTLVTSECD